MDWWRLQHVQQACRLLWTQRRFLWLLSKNDLSNRYAGSMAGVLWAYVQPILTIAAYWLVFDFIFELKVGNNSGNASRMGAYLVAGSVPWLAFCDATLRGTHALVDASALVQKSAIPPSLVISRSVLASCITFGPLLLLLPLAYIRGATGASFLAYGAVPFLVLCQFALSLLLSHILAVFSAALRDMLQITAFSLSLGIYLTPVFFPITLFPEAWRWILYLNPMTALVMSYQSVFLYSVWPPAEQWAVTGGWILALVFFLEPVLARSKNELVDWL